MTDENKEEYVLLLARHKMTESIKPYIKAFCEGFWACISLDSLRIFSPDQLGLLISGRQEISVKDMMAHVKYEGGYTGLDDTCIRWFWEIVKEMDQINVAKLLAFVTGESISSIVFHARQNFHGFVHLDYCTQGHLLCRLSVLEV